MSELVTPQERVTPGSPIAQKTFALEGPTYQMPMILVEGLAFIVLLVMAYVFVTQDRELNTWWPFIPYNTRYITGYW